MNFYRRWGRWYIHFSFGAGRLSDEDIAWWNEAESPSTDYHDPDAHLGGTWTRDGYVAHVGAQTATVTREPLNLPSNEDGS